jgi:hypothetical protein
MTTINKKKELGKRLECAQCGTKFYDLNRPKAACPKCAAPLVITDKPKFKIQKPVEIEVEAPEEIELPTDEIDVLSFDSIEEDFQDLSDESLG